MEVNNAIQSNRDGLIGFVDLKKNVSELQTIMSSANQRPLAHFLAKYATKNKASSNVIPNTISTTPVYKVCPLF